MAKDFLGKEINVGDTVVFMMVDYRYFLKAKVVSVAEKKARISFTRKFGAKRETWQFFNQLIKIDEEGNI